MKYETSFSAHPGCLIPRQTSRQMCATYLIKFYLRHRKVHQRQMNRRARYLRRIAREVPDEDNDHGATTLSTLDTIFDDLSLSDGSDEPDPTTDP